MKVYAGCVRSPANKSIIVVSNPKEDAAYTQMAFWFASHAIQIYTWITTKQNIGNDSLKLCTDQIISGIGGIYVVGKGVCEVSGCFRPIKCKKLCNRHYLRLMRSGSPYIKKKKWNEPLNFYVDNNGCFICTSHKTGVHGYPQVRHKGVPSPAHRKVYEEMFGVIPKGLVTRHKCDNRLCINHEHLEIGTRNDNVQDAVKRKRHAFGGRHKRSRLDDEKVRSIKNILSKEKVNRKLIESLSKQYDVHINTIYDIYYGNTWNHVNV